MFDLKSPRGDVETIEEESAKSLPENAERREEKVWLLLGNGVGEDERNEEDKEEH